MYGFCFFRVLSVPEAENKREEKLEIDLMVRNQSHNPEIRFAVSFVFVLFFLKKSCIFH